ncbi:unnamed protein product [Brugia timori]|uniref:Uncharacterized protein n=1 Tax=Brugia timori TaxID=42155 RepID=A0A0R3QVM9_9BILA|nr:unnamed protein product [Brugia timori]
MSTSERPLVLTRSATHQQQRLSTELAITTSSGSLPSSTHAITVTTKSTSVTFQKPFSNFIDIIVAAFTHKFMPVLLSLPTEATSDLIKMNLCSRSASLLFQ